MQVTDTILMVRPAAFAFNAETAVNNFFQNQSYSNKNLQQQALLEFDAMVKTLEFNGIDVIVANDTPEPLKPDAIFPNNWISTSVNGIVNIFPMFAQSRRLEKTDDIINLLKDNFEIRDAYDWTEFEAEGMFLEGTGSMVMDHKNKIVYACISPRTHQSLVEKFAAVNGYRAITFSATDDRGNAVYHTNVLMCIGEGFTVICSDAIRDEIEKIAVEQLLNISGNEIINISFNQMNNFAGNMLQVKNNVGEKFIVLSVTAFNSLQKDQIKALEKYGTLLPINVSTIEKASGGSVRCMMAEIFLQNKKVLN